MDDLISRFDTYIVDPILLVVFAAGFFMFMWGLLQFMINLSKGEDSSEGKMHMLYGTLGMLIMVSVYGIVGLIDHTFNLNISNQTMDTSNVNANYGQFVRPN